MALVDLQAKAARLANRLRLQQAVQLAGPGSESYAFTMIFARKLAIVCWLLLAAAIAGAAGSQLSQEHGNRLAGKIESIQRNGAAASVRPQTTRLSQTEVNSYLAFNVPEKIPHGLTNPQIGMVGSGQLSGRVYVDIDEFKRSRQSGGLMDPFSYISGQVPVSARGFLRTRDGIGQFQLAAAELHGVPLPKPLVQELVSYFSRTPERPNGFNLDEPFPLPAKIHTVTIESGEALIAQ
jgi:hypothetical protein